MKYTDLRDFITQLERTGELRRIALPVSPQFDMTEIADRVLRAQGPALLFEHPRHAERSWRIPVLANLFGTPYRVALGMGESSTEALREVGKLLAALKEPEPPKGLRDAWEKLPLLRHALTMSPREVSSAPCQQQVFEGAQVDLDSLPIQTCWPGDAGPLITWGLVVTRGPGKPRQNLGIYRQQVTRPSCAGLRTAAARSISGTTRSPIPACPSRWRWPWAPILPPSSAQSRRCPTHSPNISLQGCCVAAVPRSSAA